jgi:nickel-dependent lactate racemase
VNTILNERDEVCGLAVGHPLKAFQLGVEEARDLYCREIPRLADIVVASSYPADIDYWQALKPTDYACLGVREGGIIILVTPCPEGISPVHGEVREKGLLSYEEVLKAYRDGEIEDGVAAAALMIHAQIREHARILCVSEGLSEADKEALGFEHAETVGEALGIAIRELGGEASIGVMRCGDILPVLKS